MAGAVQADWQDAELFLRVGRWLEVVATGAACEIHGNGQDRCSAGVPRSAKSRVGTIYTIGPRAKEIVLVNDGWPLSFIGIPSTTLPDQLADFVMAMMLVGAIELGAGRFADRKGIVTFTDGTDAVVPAIDKLADEWGIPSSYLRYWRA